MRTNDPEKRNAYILSRGAGDGIYGALHFTAISKASDIRSAIASASGNTIWLAENKKSLWRLIHEALEGHRSARSLGVLIALTDPEPASVPTLSSLFSKVIAGNDRSLYHLLPRAEMMEILGADNPGDYFIAWSRDEDNDVVNLIRGNFGSIAIPASWFKPSPAGIRPDFGNISITDYGQTLKLGEYEVSNDAILYEFDAPYRSRLRKEMEKQEKGFGPSLRRLRKQKGLRLSDFSPLSEKQMRRIERNEVKKLQSKTRAILSKTLGVPFDEIETY